MYNSALTSDFAPAAVVIVVAFAAALPAYLILRRAKSGRARSAISYLLGFAAGLMATSFLGGAMKPLPAEDAPIAVIGLVASFIGPFVGMVHAKLRQPVRRRSRQPSSSQWSHSH